MTVRFPSPDIYYDWKLWADSLVHALGIAFNSSPNEVGRIAEFRGTTVPSGWLVANGSAFNGMSYPALKLLLGGTTLPNIASVYGAGYVVGIKAS